MSPATDGVERKRWVVKFRCDRRRSRTCAPARRAPGRPRRGGRCNPASPARARRRGAHPGADDDRAHTGFRIDSAAMGSRGATAASSAAASPAWRTVATAMCRRHSSSRPSSTTGMSSSACSAIAYAVPTPVCRHDGGSRAEQLETPDAARGPGHRDGRSQPQRRRGTSADEKSRPIHADDPVHGRLEGPRSGAHDGDDGPVARLRTAVRPPRGGARCAAMSLAAARVRRASKTRRSCGPGGGTADSINPA